MLFALLTVQNETATVRGKKAKPVTNIFCLGKSPRCGNHCCMFRLSPSQKIPRQEPAVAPTDKQVVLQYVFFLNGSLFK